MVMMMSSGHCPHIHTVFISTVFSIMSNLQARSTSSWRTLTSTWRRRRAFSSLCSTSKTSNLLWTNLLLWTSNLFCSISSFPIYNCFKVFQLRRAGADKGDGDGPTLWVEGESGGGEVVEEPEAGEGGGRQLAGGGGSSSKKCSWRGESCSEPSKGGKPTLSYL